MTSSWLFWMYGAHQNSGSFVGPEIHGVDAIKRVVRNVEKSRARSARVRCGTGITSMVSCGVPGETKRDGSLGRSARLERQSEVPASRYASAAPNYADVGAAEMHFWLCPIFDHGNFARVRRLQPRLSRLYCVGKLNARGKHYSTRAFYTLQFSPGTVCIGTGFDA
jgi:hypothetical protein